MAFSMRSKDGRYGLMSKMGEPSTISVSTRYSPESQRLETTRYRFFPQAWTSSSFTTLRPMGDGR